jgi:hypothetical protein
MRLLDFFLRHGAGGAWQGYRLSDRSDGSDRSDRSDSQPHSAGRPAGYAQSSSISSVTPQASAPTCGRRANCGYGVS